jgi:hypothetical protein
MPTDPAAAPADPMATDPAAATDSAGSSEDAAMSGGDKVRN